MKLLTISIAAYNVEKYLEKALTSMVCSPTAMEKLEVIIEDDGSTDGTLSIAKKYEKLTVLKLFQPKIAVTGESKYVEKFNKLFNDHIIKYGNNIIANNNRIPLNGFINIDKSLFDLNKVKFNNDNLYGQLFYTSYFLLGYIDDFYINKD